MFAHQFGGQAASLLFAATPVNTITKAMTIYMPPLGRYANAAAL